MSEDAQVLPGLGLFRSESCEVTNDPRIFLDNVVSKRFGAFETIVIAAILVASVSCSSLLAVQEPKETALEYVSLWTMIIVFLMNLFSVLVITQQYYQVFRLMTAGATGFETCKSYYLNENIMKLRHLSARSFFYSLPILCVGLGIMVMDKLGEKRYYFSIPMAVGCSIFAVVLFVVIRKHSNIFKEKYRTAKEHEDQHYSNSQFKSNHLRAERHDYVDDM